MVAIERDEALNARYRRRGPPLKVCRHRATLSDGEGKEERHRRHDAADDHNLIGAQDTKSAVDKTHRVVPGLNR